MHDSQKTFIDKHNIPSNFLDGVLYAFNGNRSVFYSVLEEQFEVSVLVVLSLFCILSLFSSTSSNSTEQQSLFEENIFLNNDFFVMDHTSLENEVKNVPCNSSTKKNCNNKRRQ